MAFQPEVHSFVCKEQLFFATKFLALGRNTSFLLSSLLYHWYENKLVQLQNIWPYALDIGKTSKYLQRVLTNVTKSLRVRDMSDAHSPCVCCLIQLCFMGGEIALGLWRQHTFRRSVFQTFLRSLVLCFPSWTPSSPSGLFCACGWKCIALQYRGRSALHAVVWCTDARESTGHATLTLRAGQSVGGHLCLESAAPAAGHVLVNQVIK